MYTYLIVKVLQYAGVMELEYISDSKSDAKWIEGSNPFARTKHNKKVQPYCTFLLMCQSLTFNS